MGKIINLSSVLEKEEKLQQVVEYMEELKDQFSDLIQEYEDCLLYTSDAATIATV